MTNTTHKFERVAFVASDNPALLVLPVDGGSAEFLAWVAEQTAGAAGGNCVNPP